jgi:AcrR family transcriptional regulator
MQLTDPSKQTNGRARPLSVENRQAMIIDAVIPLLAEHGRDLSSKQIADAAGIAEGTIFRAFGDKETLIEAAIVKFLDPEPMRRELREIDPALPLDEKVERIITIMRSRFGEIFRIMAMVGARRPPAGKARHEFAGFIAETLAPELERLNWPAVPIAHIIRLVTFASSFPHLNEGIDLSSKELTRLVLYGIAGIPSTTEGSQD